jgi:chromosome segregation ATPase
LLLLLLVVAGHGVLGELFTTVRDRIALREERDQLAARVERLQTELAVESAKRLELERHAADLNAQVAELNGQVEFLRARRPLAKSAD